MSRELELLAERFGTPLYVYQLENAAAAWAALSLALPERSLLHYSLKANPHPDVVAKLIELGARAEISSPEELDVAVSSGASPNECLYTGPAKTEAELGYAISNGVRRFSIESERDYLRMRRAAATAEVQVECLLRINGQPSGATGLRMTGSASQFGIDLGALKSGRQALASTAQTRVVGFHLFPVSNARDEGSLRDALVGSIRSAQAAAEILDIPLELVDLGGGFAAPYATPGRRPVYDDLKLELETALDDNLPGWRQGQPQIAFESGRYLVGDSGEFICTVMDVKRTGSRTFVLLDGGINHLGGMAGLGRLIRPSASPRSDGGTSDEVTLVGPLCTPADVLGVAVRLPPVKPGDKLVFPNTGAYGLTASLTAFLSRPVPVEIALDGEKTVSATRMQRYRAALDGTGPKEPNHAHH
ncbi:type III PLP-dependent enzyme [Promicromonospora sp. NPDC057488]|uniref:type III PLP-dependent enzyme n=1 Tax=Promicromonospora sp. NPDC057488 TaxID=3346147 RepID=UPI00366DAB2A